jgi:hypothetical protein
LNQVWSNQVRFKPKIGLMSPGPLANGSAFERFSWEGQAIADPGGARANTRNLMAFLDAFKAIAMFRNTRPGGSLTHCEDFA